MTTFFVDYEESLGDNFDLFVFAEDVADVPAAWLDYYQLQVTFGAPQQERPANEANALRIFETPHSGGQRPGAVNWTDVQQWWVPILKWEQE